jgi:hypothetical protein
MGWYQNVAQMSDKKKITKTISSLWLRFSGMSIKSNSSVFPNGRNSGEGIVGFNKCY